MAPNNKQAAQMASTSKELCSLQRLHVAGPASKGELPPLPFGACSINREFLLFFNLFLATNEGMKERNAREGQ
jgi:hypothetical protein